MRLVSYVCSLFVGCVLVEAAFGVLNKDLTTPQATALLALYVCAVLCLFVIVYV